MLGSCGKCWVFGIVLDEAFHWPKTFVYIQIIQSDGYFIIYIFDSNTNLKLQNGLTKSVKRQLSFDGHSKVTLPISNP